MNKSDAKRVAKLVLGTPQTFNDEELVERMASELSEGIGEGPGVMKIPELKRRLRSFLDRCANVGIKTIGDFISNPIKRL